MEMRLFEIGDRLVCLSLRQAEACLSLSSNDQMPCVPNHYTSSTRFQFPLTCLPFLLFDRSSSFSARILSLSDNRESFAHLTSIVTPASSQNCRCNLFNIAQ